MLPLTVSFIVSLITNLIVIRVSRHNSQILDYDFNGTQKMHNHPVPRIGGIGIFIAVIAGACIVYFRYPKTGEWIAALLISASMAFFSGLEEDFTKKVTPKRRFILTMISATIGYYLLDAVVARIDVPIIDAWLAKRWLSLPLTIIAVSGVVNAVNIIDGYNGLASAVSIFILLSIGYVAFQVGDADIMTASLIVVGAIAGFFILNYPNGLIFLGDGGAYFVGFLIAALAVLLVARNPQVSAWYALLVMIYPIFETIFSIYRKKYIRGISPGLPDGIHLHMLIFKRLVRWTVGDKDARSLTRRNSLTSPYLWVLSLSAVIPATLFWKHTWILVGFCIFFIFVYLWLYSHIVRFKIPSWMILK